MPSPEFERIKARVITKDFEQIKAETQDKALRPSLRLRFAQLVWSIKAEAIRLYLAALRARDYPKITLLQSQQAVIVFAENGICDIHEVRLKALANMDKRKQAAMKKLKKALATGEAYTLRTLAKKIGVKSPSSVQNYMKELQLTA